MALKDYREFYYGASEKASDVSRQLNLAGIALIWIFKAPGEHVYAIPKPLFLPGLIIVFALELDLLHYAVKAASWATFCHLQEKAGKQEADEFEAPDFINWAPLLFFWGKISATLAAYYFLIKFICFQVATV